MAQPVLYKAQTVAATYPDWLQVNFTASKTINEVDVFSIQDNYASPSEPTEAMTFSSYGLTAFQVQYWDGSAWQTVSGGSISGNNQVWRKLSFSSVTTDRIRVYITGAADGISRLAEVEAYGFGYDAAGNVINDGMHTYQYDSENRLVSVDGGATASYGYDQQNRRYKKTVGSAVTHYVWQGGQVLSEHNGGTGAVQVDYIASGGRLLAKVASGTASYFLSDRLSARLVLDTSGNVVGRQATLPFGEDFAESGTQQKQHFTSYERDSETGTDYAVNRQHNPNIGRFNRVDPITGSTSFPQSLNRYAYVYNDPINRADPRGLIPVTFCYYTLIGFLEDYGDDTGSLTIGVKPEGCITIDMPTGPVDGEDQGKESPACTLAKQLQQQQHAAYQNTVTKTFDYFDAMAEHWGHGSQAYLDQFWELWENLSYVPDPDKLQELGTKLGQAFKDAGARYSDLAHAQKYIESLRKATESYLKTFDNVKEKCGEDQAFERKTVEYGLTEVNSFFGALQKVIDSLPD